MPGAIPPRKVIPLAGEISAVVLGPEHYKLTEYFVPGLYVREIVMPKGHFIVGDIHRTEHLNVVLKGKALVKMEGQTALVEAPSSFVSKPGVSKRLYILEDCTWQTFHPNPDDERDINVLRARLVEPSNLAAELVGEIEEMKGALK